MVPSLPPSELAPLSDTTITTVSSVSPEVLNEGEHPADLLVGVRQEGGEALHEALGQARWRSSRLSQLGTHGGRGVSAVPSGTTPMTSWRAKVSSRQASQPLAKRPL